MKRRGPAEPGETCSCAGDPDQDEAAFDPFCELHGTPGTQGSTHARPSPLRLALRERARANAALADFIESLCNDEAFFDWLSRVKTFREELQTLLAARKKAQKGVAVAMMVRKAKKKS